VLLVHFPHPNRTLEILLPCNIRLQRMATKALGYRHDDGPLAAMIPCDQQQSGSYSSPGDRCRTHGVKCKTLWETRHSYNPSVIFSSNYRAARKFHYTRYYIGTKQRCCRSQDRDSAVTLPLLHGDSVDILRSIRDQITNLQGTRNRDPLPGSQIAVPQLTTASRTAEAFGSSSSNIVRRPEKEYAIYSITCQCKCHGGIA